MVRSEAVRIKNMVEALGCDPVTLRDYKRILKKLHVGLTDREVDSYVGGLALDGYIPVDTILGQLAGPKF